MVTANITNQIVEPRDPIVRIQIPKSEHPKFPIGSSYLRIRITKTNSMDSLNIFKTVFSKLLTLYAIEKDNVIKFYESYLGPGAITGKHGRKVIKTSGKVLLKDFEAELFDPKTSNYSRQCEPKFQPRIVDDAEVAALIADGKEVMKYPKDGGYVGTGKQRNYVCDRPDNIATNHIYPGVKENKPKDTKHKDKYPVIPCCYKKPQNMSKAWKDYFDKNDNIVQDDDVQEDHAAILGRIIQGVKFLQIDQMGELPGNIKKLLESYDDDNKYYRRGVSIVGSQNSFLECILQIFDEEFKDTFGPTKQVTLEQLQQYIIMKRIDIAENSELESIRQENYEYSVSEIKENLLNLDLYFDPLRYSKLLEKIYQVNIIIFSRIHGPDGTLILPNHRMNYLRWNHQYDKTIMIYQHTGSEDVMVNFPHCELIVMSPTIANDGKDIGEQLNYIVENDDILYGQLNELVGDMNKSYNLSTESLIFDIFPGSNLLPIDEQFHLESQYIDYDGKTRIINVNFKDNDFSIMTNPLPCLSIPEVGIDKSSKKVKLSVAVEFVQYLGATIVAKTCYSLDLVDRSRCIELHAKLQSEGNPIYIIMSIADSIEFVDKQDQVDHQLDDQLDHKICEAKDILDVMMEFVTDYKDDRLEKFKYLRNLAEWLKEYNFWLFSKYCAENGKILDEHDIDEKLLSEYIRDKIVYIDNYQYTKPLQLFSRHHPFFKIKN